MESFLIREHTRGNDRCYGNGRTRNELAQPIFVGKKDRVQLYVRCIYCVRNSFRFQ